MSRSNDKVNTNTTPDTTEAADATRRLALRPKEAAQALGIGPRLLWSMTNRGEIPHLKLGKAVLYPVAELERRLSERAVKGAQP